MPPRKTTSTTPSSTSSPRPRTRQSTLSFGTKSARISKPTGASHIAGKDGLKAPSSSSSRARSISPAAAREAVRAISITGSDAGAEKGGDVDAVDLPGAKTGSDNVLQPLESEVVETRAEKEVKEVEESEEEVKARGIERKQLMKYHQDILAVRRCKPLHQEELTLEEKILRHFDMSSQYGSCIGISRLDRWKRAQRLGLEPPLEVLTVALMMEDTAGGKDKTRDTRISYIDDFLSTRSVPVE